MNTAAPLQAWWDLFQRVIMRHWSSTRGQTTLIILLLSVGVGVFLSVRLANRAAVANFQHFTEVLSGTSDWVVTPVSGSLPLGEVAEMRRALGAQPVHLLPLVEVVTAAPRREGADWGDGAYTLLGVDLFAAANLGAAEGRQTLPWREMKDEYTAWTTAHTLAEVGNKLDLVLADQIRTLNLLGPIPTTPGQPAPPERLLIAESSEVQQWVNRPHAVDRVEVILETGPRQKERTEEVRRLLEETGRGRWAVEAPGARRESAEQMTAAFRLNLTILSLIALLVGLYLIGQTLEGAVVRRRAEIATLRSLGVSSGQIQALWLSEAAALGLVGSAVGLALGWLGAQAAVLAVGRTVNALYFTTSAATAHLQTSEVVAALLLGTLACLGAAWGPARLAAATPPAQLLAQTRSGGPAEGSRALGVASLVLLALGVVLAWLPAWPLSGGGQFPLAGHTAAFLWIAGAGLLAGPLLALLARAFRRRQEGSAPQTVAFAYLTSPSRRHRIALAGIVCATAMTAGMMILVSSFEKSVRGWISQALQADLYISSLGAQSASAQSRLNPETLARLAQWRGVTDAEPHWLQKIRWRGRPTQVHGANLAQLEARSGMLWLQTPRAVTREGHHAAWASETFLYRFGLAAGDTLVLPTPSGDLPVQIVATFSDYGNEQGALWLDFATVQQAWRETGATSVALRTAPGVSTEALRRELRAAFPALAIYENASLRREILRIFRQTFSLTYALEVIGLVVALAGLALTLISMGLERRSDLTTLRALGFSRKELAAVSRHEASSLAAVAALVGITLSVALGWLLVYVINRQSFGWTLQWQIPWLALLLLGLVLVASGALVGHFVGRWGAALPADERDLS